MRVEPEKTDSNQKDSVKESKQKKVGLGILIGAILVVVFAALFYMIFQRKNFGQQTRITV